jgi:outer membrane receptor protein involved in Fe transport
LRLLEEGRFASAGTYVHPDPDDPLCAPFCDWSDARTLDDHYGATSVALFAQLDGNLAGHWRWSAGLRLEQRSAAYRDTGEASVAPFRARDRMLGGQLSLSRDIGDALTGYALLSRGYKAGGFNLGSVPAQQRQFEPEFLWNIESGLKARLPEGRGHADVAVFYQRRIEQQERSGLQLFPGGPYEFITTNLSGRGYGAGIEASIEYNVLPQLTLGASLGLLRSRTPATTDEDGNPVRPRENAHAPEYTAALNAAWRHPAGFFARVDLTATDDFYFDVPTDHDRKSRAHALAHLKVGFERENWRVHGWLRNAFDEQYAVRGFYFANDPRTGWIDELYRQRGDPRQLGVTVAVDF